MLLLAVQCAIQAAASRSTVDISMPKAALWVFQLIFIVLRGAAEIAITLVEGFRLVSCRVPRFDVLDEDLFATEDNKLPVCLLNAEIVIEESNPPPLLYEKQAEAIAESTTQWLREVMLSSD
jgi:hypothetical protein